MNFESYINLLHSLSSASLNIWGFLLTVSLGIIAFLGSVQSFRWPFAVILCMLFIAFAFSNHFALKKNFAQRDAVVTALVKLEQEPKYESSSLKSENQLIIESFSVKNRTLSLVFQVFISVLVSFLIIAYPAYLSRMKESMPAVVQDLKPDDVNKV